MTAESNPVPPSDPLPAEDTLDTQLRAILRDVLSLSDARVAAFELATPLFGALPELDSMAVAGLLTEMEDRLHIIIEDDDVDGETFETFGSLLAFAEAKTRR